MTKTCEHDGCDCPLEAEKAVSRNGRSYCSETCAGAKAGRCTCGHAVCAGSAGA